MNSPRLKLTNFPRVAVLATGLSIALLAATVGSLSAQAAPTTPSVTAPVTRISDFNRDGFTDLVARDWAGTLWLYPGNGAGAFKGRTSMGAGWNTFMGILTAGDVNGDGNGDVMAMNLAGQLFLYPGNGIGGFKGRTSLGLGWNGMTDVTAAGEMTGDAFPDILASDRAGRLWLYPSTGTGAFKGRILAEASGWDAMTGMLGAGDLSGDGRADLVARDRAGNLWINQGDDNRGFGARIWAGAGWNAMDSVAAPGNFDRASGNDLIARDSAGKLWLYPGNNNGRFEPRRALGAGFSQYFIA